MARRLELLGAELGRGPRPTAAVATDDVDGTPGPARPRARARSRRRCPRPVPVPGRHASPAAALDRSAPPSSAGGRGGVVLVGAGRVTCWWVLGGGRPEVAGAGRAPRPAGDLVSRVDAVPSPAGVPPAAAADRARRR